MAVKTPFPIVPLVRIPMGARLRIASDVMMSSMEVDKSAPKTRQRRQFRLAMEKRKRIRLRLWRGNVR